MEAHGDEDSGPEPTKRDLELALEEVVECILDHGQWPRKGRKQFDLYDFIDEHRDASYALEMYVTSMSSNTRAFKDRVERERRAVEALLIEHLRDSEIVEDLAAEFAAEDAE